MFASVGIIDEAGLVGSIVRQVMLWHGWDPRSIGGSMLGVATCGGYSLSGGCLFGFDVTRRR